MKLRLIIAICLFPLPLMAEEKRIELGSIFGSFDSAAPKTTVQLITSGKTISGAINGSPEIYIQTESEKPVNQFYPQFKYRHPIDDDVLWDINIIFGQTKEITQTSIGTNITYFEDRSRPTQNDLRTNIGFSLGEGVIFKLGYIYNETKAPSTQLLAGVSESGIGFGSLAQITQGPFLGWEFDIPISEQTHFFADIVYDYARGNLRFDTVGAGTNTSYIVSSNQLEVHSFLFDFGLRYFHSETRGLKFGYFLQFGTQKVLTAGGINYSSGNLSEIKRLNSDSDPLLFNGFTIAYFTSLD